MFPDAQVFVLDTGLKSLIRSRGHKEPIAAAQTEFALTGFH